jgi:hypothetical protein
MPRRLSLLVCRARIALLERPSPDRASSATPSSTSRAAVARRVRRDLVLIACLAAVVGAAGGVGCATRTREDRIINRYGLDVYLRSERKPFGPAVDHGYAHPSDISMQRLEIILGSLQIERRVGARSKLEPAIPAEILAPVCEALAQAFR